jgi:hypothetical protein
MTCPTVKAKRLSLVPFEEKHLSETYVDWLNNPAVVKYSELRHNNHTLGTASQYYKNMLNSCLQVFNMAKQYKYG